MENRSRTLLPVVAAVFLASAAVFVAPTYHGTTGRAWQTSDIVVSAGAPSVSESPNSIPVEYPSYAPDGREVAFNTTWPGSEEILAVSTVDGRLRWLVGQGVLPGSAHILVHPAWSPSGKWIAFATERAEGVRSNIWLVRPDGSGLIRVTTGPAHDDEPAWSPDGTRIAFTSGDLARGRNDIWIVNVNGSGLRRVTQSQSWLPSLFQSAYHPSFSPDGIRIVFSQGFSPNAMGGCGSNKLVIINADGTSARQLTSGPAEPETSRVFDSHPSWWKQGILFHSARCGSVAQIMMIQPNGTGLHAIPNATGWQPAWSPDGTKFAFVRAGDYVYNASGWGVYEFNFSNGAIRALVQIRGFSFAIDIMPDPSPKVISLRETALIRVAILSQPNFDPAQQVDQTSITFGKTGDEHSLAFCAAERTDLVCNFKTALTGFRPGDTQGILRLVAIHTYPAGSIARIHFEGRDTVQIVP